MPEQNEAEALLRDIPRFELGMPSSGINVTAWMPLGNGVLRSRIKSNLLKIMGVEVKQSLHLYGNALSRWGHQFASRMAVLVNSHADAYRVQLHRIGGTTNDRMDVAQLEQDLAVLTNWTSKQSNEAIAHHK